MVFGCLLHPNTQALIAGKKVQFRKPAPGTADAVPSRKRATPINLASAIRKSGGSGASSVVQRPFRDRVLHLLALRPYRKAELLLRLQKDGLTQADKDTLDSLLQQVGAGQPDHQASVASGPASSGGGNVLGSSLAGPTTGSAHNRQCPQTCMVLLHSFGRRLLRAVSVTAVSPALSMGTSGTLGSCLLAFPTHSISWGTGW